MAGGLLALVVGAALAPLFLAIADLRLDAGRTRHAQEVFAAANQLERLVIDLETGQLGFVITGDERFLAPWQDARTAFAQHAEALERLAAAQGAGQENEARRITQAR